MNHKDSPLIHDIEKQIIISLNLTGLTRAQQEKVTSMFVDTVASRVNMAVWEMSGPEDREVLARASKMQDEKFMEYLMAKIKDFPTLVQEVTRQVVSEFNHKRTMAHAHS